MKKILVILGPTATGKTDLACQLARKFDGELVAADSRQVYKYLDIGTGKYSPNDTYKKFVGKWLLNNVVIHGYDLIKPGTRFTAANFAKFFEKIVNKIWSKNKLPILVGGTGFYIQAALTGFETLGIPQDVKLRTQLEKMAVGKLFEKLRKLNKAKAASLSPSDKVNPRRLIRAIEVALFLKAHPKFVPMYLPASSLSRTRPLRVAKRVGRGRWQAGPYMDTSKVDVLKIGLACERRLLYKKIDKRVDVWLKMGMIGEIRNLLKKKVKSNWLETLGLEYYWITSYLLGKIGYQTAIERLKGAIHDFARRQMTWFKKDSKIVWFDIDDKNFSQKVAKVIKKWYD